MCLRHSRVHSSLTRRNSTAVILWQKSLDPEYLRRQQAPAITHVSSVLLTFVRYAATQVRAQGVGQALIEAVYKLADERGAPKVYWQTHEQNYR
jgi:GNAT superfamily N-acetyltransferase